MKTGNISTALKLILFAVSALITCMVVFIGMKTSEEAKKISNSAIDQISEINNDIIESEIMMYDNNEVYGSDVINFIKKNLGDYTSAETAPTYVYVKTSATEYTYTNNTYESNISQFTDTHYIKPTAIFIGVVVKNRNDVIVGIRFTQN